MTETASAYLVDRLDFFTPERADLDYVRNRREAIYKRLDADHVVSVFETGSMTHGTGVWLFSDVDYFVRFYDSRPTPDTALERVKRSMAALYPQTPIRISRPAVKVGFTTRSHLELVPAYSAGEDDVFWIPDPTAATGWMKSAPKRHLGYVNEAQRQQPNTKAAVRLMKLWKRERQVPISSFYLEMRTAKLMSDRAHKLALIDAVEAVFAHLHTEDLAALRDPTLFGGLIHACSSEPQRERSLSKLATGYSDFLRGRIADYKGNNVEAVTHMRKVFG